MYITFCPTRQKPQFENFTLDNSPIEHSDRYCYLGIVVHRNGSFNEAFAELRAKSIRVLYGLRNNIIIIKNSLSHKSHMTIFDSLVKPVLLYGCQVLAPQKLQLSEIHCSGLV